MEINKSRGGAQVDLQAEIRVLLANLGYETADYSDNLAYVLRSIYTEYESLDRTVLELLEEKIRTQNSYRFA
ncbi:hypothetical protein D3C73_1055980 [compost metagenome]